MASNSIQETAGSPRQLRIHRQVELPGGSRFRWWLLGLAAVVVIAIAVSAATLLSRARSAPDVGSLVTHTIARRDLLVTVTEQGTLESSNNTEIKCGVRGDNTIIWVIENGTEVKPGDELVRLETLLIDEEISERTKYAHLADSAAERSRADAVRAELAISEYLEGRYVSELAALETDLAIAESRLLTSKNMRDHAKIMANSGYVSELELEEKEFAVEQAGLAVKLKKTQIDVLKRFTKEEQLARLKGDWNAAKAQHEADKERVFADNQRLKRAQEELLHCVEKADRSGVVIYPTAEAWKEAPEIEEGATVHKDQVLLLMPDLTKMQVKVGIHESVIDRVKPGLVARVTLPDTTVEAQVTSVSPVTRPAGWWTGNVVKYDTIIELPPVDGLKPGMSAEVEVVLARHEHVLTVPTAAVLATASGYACWVVTPAGIERRSLTLGDSSDMFIVVEAGLNEGDKVVLNPLAFVEEAQIEAAKTLDKTERHEPNLSEI